MASVIIPFTGVERAGTAQKKGSSILPIMDRSKRRKQANPARKLIPEQLVSENNIQYIVICNLVVVNINWREVKK